MYFCFSFFFLTNFDVVKYSKSGFAMDIEIKIIKGEYH